MQYALLIYERPHDFDRREDEAEEDAYTGAWQAWHKALWKPGSSSAATRWTRRKPARRCGCGTASA